MQVNGRRPAIPTLGPSPDERDKLMKTILLIAFVLALGGAFIASAADDAAAEASATQAHCADGK
jgi:hypothetical protein